MEKRLIVYDVDETDNDLFMQCSKDTLLFSAAPSIKQCVGCFGCWIKTPGKCVINDRYAILSPHISKSSEIIFISPIIYGGFSVNIKRILERSIGYILPYERSVNGEMHHKLRYDNPYKLNVFFYGPCDNEERDIAKRLVAANALNMGAGSHTVSFYDTASLVKEALA